MGEVMIKEVFIDKDYRELMLSRLSSIDFVGVFQKKEELQRDILSVVDGSMQELLTDYTSIPSYAKVLLLRGLPLDEYIPQTPLFSSELASIKTPITQLMLLSIGINLGTPIGFSSENNGAIIHNISPMKDKIRTKSGQGSSEPMGMHSDFAFSDHRPDWLILMCLRNEQKIPTRICLVNDICNQLSFEEVEMLKSPNFLIFPPDSSAVKEPRRDAILFQKENDVISRFNKDKCKGVDTKYQAILDKFASIADNQGQEVFLNPGDALILDNRYALHSRQSFTARYDGTDRWLQRVYCRAVNNSKDVKIERINDLLNNGVA